MPARCSTSGPASAPTRDAIARGLAARPGLSVGLFAPRPFPATFNGAGPFSLHADHHPFGIVWLHSTLPQRIDRWGAGVLVSALTIGPARGEVPFVSTVHDLTPLTHPEWHASRTVIGFVPLWDRTVERAARFLCVSQTTANDLVARYPETAGRVRVAENGVDSEFFSPPTTRPRRQRTRQRYADGRPFLLYLGTLEPRKNVEALVAACERLWGRRRSRPDLVLAGGAGWKTAGAPPADRPLRLPGQDPRGRLRRPRRRPRTLPRRRGVRLPVPRRRLRASGSRGDGLRHSGRGLDGRRAASRSAATPRCTPRRETSRPCPARSNGSWRTRRCGRRSRPPGRRAPRSSRGNRPSRRRPPPSPKRRGPIRELGRRAAGRDRRAQAQGLRDRLLHPQPPRSDRTAAGGRGVSVSRLRALRGPGRRSPPLPANFEIVEEDSAGYSLSELTRFSWRLLRDRLDLFHATHYVIPPLAAGARGRDDSRHHPRALSAVPAQPRRASLRPRHDPPRPRAARTGSSRSRTTASGTWWTTSASRRHASTSSTTASPAGTTRTFPREERRPGHRQVRAAAAIPALSRRREAPQERAQRHPRVRRGAAGAGAAPRARSRRPDAEEPQPRGGPDRGPRPGVARWSAPAIVPEEDLPGLFAGADAFLYPTLYEGFGLPVVEAMACGVPVLTSSTSALQEIAGGYAYLVDPMDVDAIARGIVDLATDPSRRAGVRRPRAEAARPRLLVGQGGRTDAEGLRRGRSGAVRSPIATRMRTAVVHDWLNGMRGGEKVLEAILPLVPEPTIFTLFHVPGRSRPPSSATRSARRFSIGCRSPGALPSLLPSFPGPSSPSIWRGSTSSSPPPTASRRARSRRRESLTSAIATRRCVTPTSSSTSTSRAERRASRGSRPPQIAGCASGTSRPRPGRRGTSPTLPPWPSGSAGATGAEAAVATLPWTSSSSPPRDAAAVRLPPRRRRARALQAVRSGDRGGRAARPAARARREGPGGGAAPRARLRLRKNPRGPRPREHLRELYRTCHAFVQPGRGGLRHLARGSARLRRAGGRARRAAARSTRRDGVNGALRRETAGGPRRGGRRLGGRRFGYTEIRPRRCLSRASVSSGSSAGSRRRDRASRRAGSREKKAEDAP